MFKMKKDKMKNNVIMRTIFLMVLVGLIANLSLGSVYGANSNSPTGKIPATWDNVKKFTNNGNSYGKYEIKNAFGLGKKIMDIELKENTETCGEECFAIKEIVLNDETSLIDDVTFYTLQEDESWNEQPIRSYQFYIKTNEQQIWVDDYSQVQTGTSPNGTLIYENQISGGHYEDTPEWTPYELGTVMPLGTYEVKLVGHKKPSRTVDWIVKTNGEVLDEWAVWGEVETVYDEIDDSSINWSLWENSTTGTVSATENGDYMRLEAQNGYYNLSSSSLPNRSYIENIVLRVRLSSTEIGGGDTTSTLKVFGHTIKSVSNTNDLSTWRIQKNGTLLSDNWDIYDDGVYQSTFSGSNNLIRVIGTDEGTGGQALNDLYYVYYNFTEAEVILNSPADDSTSTTNELEFNATATVTGGAYITNMSLWTNETGSWEEKNSSSVIRNNYSHGISLPSTQTLATQRGMQIKIGNSNLKLNSVTKSSTSTAPSVNINYAGGANIGTATFSGDVATFSQPITLYAGESYYLVSSGSHTFSKNDAVSTYPVVSTYFNWTSGVTSTPTLTSAFNFESIDISLGETQTFNRTITDDIVWNVQACDSDGDCGFSSSNYSLSIDAEAPTISITSPEAVVDTHILGNNLNLNTTITDNNLDTCWYNYNGTNTTFSCTSGVQASEEFATVAGEQSITVWANDSVGNINSESTSWTYNFIENSATYNDPAYETSSETLTLNFTTDITVQSISSNLIYDGTEYESTTSCNGNTCILNNTIDIPLLNGGSVNNTFYWEFTIFDGTSSNTYNSTSRTQEVNPIILIECNGTYTTKALNFTVYDEGNLTKLEPFSFDGTFNYWLGNGNSYKTYSISNSSTNEMDLCISPTDKNFKINAEINYDSSTGTYIERSYYFNNYQINNSLQNISLLLLESEDSTSFIQQVLENQLGVENAYIYTYKYYPGLGEYKITQITKTDSSGETIGFYEAETSSYKHDIYVGGELRLSESDGKAIPSSTPYTITFYLGSSTYIPWEIFDEKTGLSKSLSFNANTKIVTYSYTDNNLTNNGGRLLVYNEKYATDDVLVINESSALSSRVISGDVSNYTGNFIAQAYITRNNQDILVDLIRFNIDDKINTFGEAGILLAWFIILVAAMAFLFDAVIGLIAINLAIIFVNLIGFASFGLTYIFGILITSIIIMWLMKK